MAKYFKDFEFKRCVPSCSIDNMSVSFMACLDDLRERFGKPIFLTSAYRTIEYEKSHGRSGTSSHCKGLAVDIKCNNSFDRHKLISAILDVIPSARIGIYPTFLHLDIDTDKPCVIWVADIENI